MECVYLGHVVGNGTLQPEQDKLKAVQGTQAFGQTVCNPDDPSLPGVVGQTQGKQCPFVQLESGPTALPISGATHSGENKQQCGCTVSGRRWATDCRFTREWECDGLENFVVCGCMT